MATMIGGASSTQGTYTAASPYYVTDVVDGNFLDILEDRPIAISQNDVLYELAEVYQYRPDLLAYDLYGDPKLWWVFAARNPNVLGPDPYFNFVKGVSIYVPNIKNLKYDLGI
jgi:alpha-L-fucosidase